MHYQNLLGLAQQLLKFCEETDLNNSEATNQLLELLQKRSKIIDQIDEINAVSNHKLDEQEVSLVKEIMEVDQSSRKLLESNRFEVEVELQKIKDGKRSNKAYQPSGIQTEGYFVDHKK